MADSKRHLRYVLALDEGELVCRVLEGKGRFLGRLDLRDARNGAVMATLDAEDRVLLMQLYMVQGLNGTLARLTGANGYQLLRKLIGTKRCCWKAGNGPVLRWRDKSRPARLAWRMDGSFLPCLESEGDALCLPLAPALWLEPEAGDIGEFQIDGPPEAARAWLAGGRMGEREVAKFSADILRRFPGMDIPALSGRPKNVRGRQGKPLLRFTLAPNRPEGLGVLPNGEFVASLNFAYGEAVFEHGAPIERMTVLEQGKLVRVYRDEDAEEGQVERLRALGFVPVSELGRDYVWVAPRDGFVFAPDLESVESLGNGSERFAAAVSELRADGWSLRFEKLDLDEAPDESKWFSRLRANKRNDDWFEFEAGVKVGRQTLNLLPLLRQLLVQWRGSSPEQIRRLLLSGPVLAKLDDQRAVALAGERLWFIVERLFELYDVEPLTKKGRIEIDKWRAAELAGIPGMLPEDWNGLARVKELVDTLRAGLELEPLSAPPGFNGELREYQRVGLGWLEFLRKHAMHGILADDMGLGKTVQTLAHLLAEKAAGRLKEPALIVAPTSLMRNWREEARQFVPQLKCVVFHGADRHQRLEAEGGADLILTTYALLRIDADLFRETKFSFLILDEAQAIKNAKSQAGTIARELKAERRLCLTGTPMENHLGELWSLFDFLMPGFLGDARTFKTRVRDPIEQAGREDRQAWLSGRVAPFMLRRTKDEVAAELPSKTEIVQTVGLTEAQRDLYETIRVAMDGKVRDEIADKGLARSHIVILDALLKLRQICCDPRLLEKNKRKLKAADSAKLFGLMDLLPELIEEGRSVLLFSQFTSMLDLIEKEVKRAGITFVKLTGSTKDRATPIERFQNGEVPLFLISLKAGGAGLNLTAADTVIHFDPWWNPAVERQATDRAHRIGQDKPVFVYKLLTEGTVEEKIQLLQKRKADLVEGILSGSLKDKLAFTEEDLRELFG